MKQENVGSPSQSEEGFRNPMELLKSLKPYTQQRRLVSVLVRKVGLTETNAESIAELLSIPEMKKLRKRLERKVSVNPLCGKEKAKVLRRRVRRIWLNQFMSDWAEDPHSHRRS